MKNYYIHIQSGAIILGWPSLLSSKHLAGTVIFPALDASKFRPEQKLNLLAHCDDTQSWNIEEFKIVTPVNIEFTDEQTTH